MILVTPPSITIAICTWNRSQLLRGCLEKMLGLEVAADVSWNIVVVNNNSTDATEAVVEEFVGRLPVRSVIERKQGLSNARNRAVDECDTDYILWTDDDVRVPRDWVQVYADAIREFSWPTVLGGDITPDFGSNSPAWLLDGWELVANAYAVRRSPGQGVVIEAGHFPFGANYATRIDGQRRHRYDPNLGRSGGSMLSGEEEAVIGALLNEPKASGIWLGSAEVIHRIEPFRQSLSYLRSYFAGHGEVEYRMTQRLSSQAADDARVPLWMFRALAQQYCSYLYARYIKRDKNWLRVYVRFAFTIGELKARANA
ncbi:MAG: glycosyltransferase involved in cell wall biosynthesis [Congregibacter sp.]|jgi:glycosyltransferase involved in cell wall biosynthesis